MHLCLICLFLSPFPFRQGSLGECLIAVFHAKKEALGAMLMNEWEKPLVWVCSRLRVETGTCLNRPRHDCRPYAYTYSSQSL
ncbi:hypothetical protein LZ31DRAFT_127272 [Colletotrichum somersetense]|nr:hypothetical protein LZ31DRAFT_127272 [Colletotrichum somersetense]